MIAATVDKNSVSIALRKLEGLPNKVANAIERKAITQSAKYIQEIAKRFCPTRVTGGQRQSRTKWTSRAYKRGGLLKSSIKVKAPRKRRKKVISRQVRTGQGPRGKEVKYAAIVEYGGKTRNYAARPFMRPAADLGWPYARRRFTETLEQLVRQQHQI